MSDQELVKDVAEALLFLQRALMKHGMGPITSVEMRDMGDFMRFRSLRPDHTYLSYPAPPLHHSVAARIVDVNIRQPSGNGG